MHERARVFRCELNDIHRPVLEDVVDLKHEDVVIDMRVDSHRVVLGSFHDCVVDDCGCGRRV